MKPGGHQPYARGARQPGPPLAAMLRGAPMFLPNPMDARRQVQKAANPRGLTALMLGARRRW